MRPRLIPFRAEHLMSLVDRDFAVSTGWEYAVALERNGPAYTAVVDGKVIGCAGVRIVWPGVGEAWVSLAQEADHYGLWLTRVIRAVLRDIIRTQRLHRVECQVLADNRRNQKWVRLLGFRQETGLARAYTADKRDVERYEWLR